MAKVSLVMPVYNTARYLEESVAGILAQTFGDFELVLVDDGSTDDSLAVLQRLAAADARLRVVPREHESAGAARNAGLDMSTGDYIAFIDSDDIYHPRYVQSLLEAQAKFDADVVECASVEFQDGEDAVFPPGSWGRARPFVWHNSEKDLFRRWRGWTGYRLLRRAMIVERGIRFPSLAVAEDMAFAFASLASAAAAVRISDVLVARRRRSSSSVETRALHPDGFLCALRSCRELIGKCAPEYPIDGLPRYAAKMYYWYARAMAGGPAQAALRGTLPVLKGAYPSLWWWKWYRAKDWLKRAFSNAAPEAGAGAPMRPVGPSSGNATLVVLVATYNRLECLKRLVAAVRENAPGVDLLVVDNASTDGTGEWLAKEKIDTMSLSENTGGAGAFAAGLAEVRRRGWDYVWMMDDDVLPLPGSVRALLEYAKRYDAVQPAKLDSEGRIWEFEGIVDEKSLRRRRMPYEKTFAAVDAAPCNAACFEGLFMKTALVDSAGLPDASFFIAFDDIYYGMRIARKSSLVYVKTPCIQKQFDKEAFRVGARRFYSSSAAGRYYHLRNFRRVMRLENLGFRAWVQFAREWIKAAALTLVFERDLKGLAKLAKAVRG